MDGGMHSGGRGRRNHHGVAGGRRGGTRVQRVARARLHSYKARRRRGRGEDEDEENRPTKKRDSKSPEGRERTRRGEISSGSAGGIVCGVSERRHRREVVGVRCGARTVVRVPTEARGELWLAVLARRRVAVERVACERNIRRCDVCAGEFGHLMVHVGPVMVVRFRHRLHLGVCCVCAVAVVQHAVSANV